VLLSSLFAENFNITSLLVFVPLLIALMSFILSKTVLKDNAKCEKVFKKSVGEYTFNGLMFCGYVVGVSFAL
jgi:hypothetical protein